MSEPKPATADPATPTLRERIVTAIRERIVTAIRERVAPAWKRAKPVRDWLRRRTSWAQARARTIPAAVVAANPLMLLLVLSAHALAVSVLWVGIVACWRYILGGK